MVQVSGGGGSTPSNYGLPRPSILPTTSSTPSNGSGSISPTGPVAPSNSNPIGDHGIGGTATAPTSNATQPDVTGSSVDWNAVNARNATQPDVTGSSVDWNAVNARNATPGDMLGTTIDWDKVPEATPATGGDPRQVPQRGGNQPPADTRTQAQKEAQIAQSFNSAREAAANGDPKPLQDLHRYLGIAPPRPEELKRAYYGNYAHRDLSAADSKAIKDWFIRNDANNDGQISKNELPTNPWSKNAPYAGSDNKISIGEAQEYHRGLQGGIDAKLADSNLPAGFKKELREWFMAVDKNNDGQLQRSEMASGGQSVHRADLGDNIVTVDEAIAHYEKMGSTIDAQLSNSGLPAAKQAEIKNYFMTFDKDRNGYITKNEVNRAANWGTKIGPEIIADGKYTVGESINYHRGQAGMPALTNQQIMDPGGKGLELPGGTVTPPATPPPPLPDPIPEIPGINGGATVSETANPVPQAPESSGISGENDESQTFDNGGFGPNLPNEGVLPGSESGEGPRDIGDAVSSEDQTFDNGGFGPNLPNEGVLPDSSNADKNNKKDKEDKSDASQNESLEKQQALAMATANKQSAKEARLKKIMEMRKPYMGGAASVNGSSDSIVVPPIVPASQVPPPPLP